MSEFSEYQKGRKVSICSKGLAVAWQDLEVSALIGTEKLFSKTEYSSKKIIHGVSGAVVPESLIAIMGPSGSGKSTLMSVLANRNPVGLQVEGTITIGGRSKGDFTRYVSGFVYQDDLFMSALTVFEHLNFTAKLKLGHHINEQARRVLIEDILSLLGLSKIAHLRIGKTSYGNEKINLSGGERKRLSIAAELITDPGLLFCDEPTTGLDSFTALSVITYLKSLAILKEKTIVCSIHQPNSQIFGLFHQIILMCQGRIVFNGSSDDAILFFQEQGFLFNANDSPADYLIRSLAHEVNTKKTVNDICENYQRSKFSLSIQKLVEKEIHRQQYHSSVIYYKTINPPSIFRKLCYLTHRSTLLITRDASVHITRLVQKLFIALLIGLTLHGTITWTQTGLTSLKGVIFFMIMQNFFPPIHVAMNHIPKQLALFHREYSNNINSPSTFYLSNVLCLLPGFIIDPILFTLVICFLTNLTNSFVSIALTCLMTTLALNTSAAFGVLASVLFKRLDIASSYISPTEITLVICSGVYAKLSTIPLILRWIPYVSWFTYAVEALFIIHLDGVTKIDCDFSAGVPCLKTGDEVLASYDFNSANLIPDIIKIVCIYIVLHILAYIYLLRSLRKRTA